MGSRRKAREYALQILFQIDFHGQKLHDVLDQFWHEQHESDELREFTQELVTGTLRNLQEIDAVLEKSSTNWKLSRMNAVDRNALRMAVFELLYLVDIPHSVTINESVEIVRKFGTEESSSFINGILDNISKSRHD